jgi:hypothetical protein
VASKRKARGIGKRDPKPAKAKVRKAVRRPSRPVSERVPATVETPDRSALDVPEPDTETSQAALVRIAQDAVIILRRELSFRAQVSLLEPGSISMGDCIALLRLTTELGAAARKGETGQAQAADYSRLSPQERVQLAGLLLKVDYTDTP